MNEPVVMDIPADTSGLSPEPSPADFGMPPANERQPAGRFVDLAGERYYAISDVDRMAPFFLSVVSGCDHWLFVSSTGGLTAGRVSPESSLFPYVPDDKIHDSWNHTGPKTVIIVRNPEPSRVWEPFNLEHDGRYKVQRNLYKNTLGNKLCFEEINHDLKLTFRYTWATSDAFGFVRTCVLDDHSGTERVLDVLDGMQDIQPAGAPRDLQLSSSNLVDAYKWNELDAATGLAFYTLYSGISDKPEPQESLLANTVFSIGPEDAGISLSCPRRGIRSPRAKAGSNESVTRGVRGAYWFDAALVLEPNGSRQWLMVADVNKTQAEVVSLRRRLSSPGGISQAEVDESIRDGTDLLAKIIGGVDGFQLTAEEKVTAHHYANALFNGMRGGVYNDQYNIDTRDFLRTVSYFNSCAFKRHRRELESLPDGLPVWDLLERVKAINDVRIESLAREYLPITFGRRHGDPSRPWNHFEIRLKAPDGTRRLYYQGNWRDIFQNWEALSLGYPEFVESIIAKFVNASTLDGYNPYRITKEGIDWEVEDPDDPWSYIGYWGDHQIIYLLKLLEISRRWHPDLLQGLLQKSIFCYANVPYRIKPFEALLEDPKNTVVYDQQEADEIARRVAALGADGKLVCNREGDIHHVNLLEKLLVPLLAKLGNLVIGGGVWLNTQRPEWNDANNALVGPGLSMVTLYYLRRYVGFLRDILGDAAGSFPLTLEVSLWLHDSLEILGEIRKAGASNLGDRPQRFRFMRELGEASSRYRESIYRRDRAWTRELQDIDTVKSLLDFSVMVIDDSIHGNRRPDGLYHAYNLLEVGRDSFHVRNLYPMLEGQVAVLSSGAIRPKEGVKILQALFDSEIYRADQHSFMLYPDRKLPGFLAKNRMPAAMVLAIPLLREMIQCGDDAIVLRDDEGWYRFNGEISNSRELAARLDLGDSYPGVDMEESGPSIMGLYEQVFNHIEFTGRSGGMFGFEGLGCIYWHMVSKLLLAVQELFFAAVDEGNEPRTAAQLGEFYYRIRDGLGFNKSPAEYGAFPMDPYSHTPGHAGARQPGMTGQVKEEILTRFGELGVRVHEGEIRFDLSLLRTREFVDVPLVFHYLDVDGDWKELGMSPGTLAFTWCQVPVIYVLDDTLEPACVVEQDDGQVEEFKGSRLSRDISREIFTRSGRVRKLVVHCGTESLFDGPGDVIQV